MKRKKRTATFKCPDCGNDEAVLRLSDGDPVPGRLVIGDTDFGPFNPLLNILLVCTKCGKKTRFENCVIESHTIGGLDGKADTQDSSADGRDKPGVS